MGPYVLWQYNYLLQMARTLIHTISELSVGQKIRLSGWVVTVRDQKKLLFIKLADSWRSRIKPFQVVFQIDPTDPAYDQLRSIGTGFSITVTGTVVKCPLLKGGKVPEQPYELVGETYKVLGKVYDTVTYPMAKTDLSLEHLRSFPALECFSSTKAAIYGIRSLLLFATESFFRDHEFTKVDMPAITFSECEGGCQPMQATLLLTEGSVSSIPTVVTQSGPTDRVDFSKDFFGAKASLTVSAQLELETQLPLGHVWTMTRAFRGEPSQTTRHLCEFSMVELEMQFIESAKDIMDITEKYIKFCLSYVLKDEYGSLALDLLSSKLSKGQREKLQRYIDEPFVRITHTEVVTLLLGYADKFTSPPAYDDDMGSEHERYLTDVIFKHPVIVMGYPKKVKAFYMPIIDEGAPVEHVDSFDILVPEVGELVGGSARIDTVEELEHRITDLGMSKGPLEFYLDLRRCGSVPHGGMGMGFERLVKFVTGADSVKDCVAYPRFLKSGKGTVTSSTSDITTTTVIATTDTCISPCMTTAV